MSHETIRYVAVWSGWVRLTHWLLAAGVGFQLLSALALQWGAVDDVFWRDWHVIVGQLLIVTVVGRIVLAFLLTGSAHWRAFLPDAAQWQGIKQMLMFYFSFARAPLPNWFAHNPLWRQVYPLWWLLVLATAFSGLYYNSATPLLGMTLFAWHKFLASSILVLSLVHVLAVFLHDLKGKGASVSGMISGYRYFHVAASEKLPKPSTGKASITHVAINSIQKPPKR